MSGMLYYVVAFSNNILELITPYLEVQFLLHVDISIVTWVYPDLWGFKAMVTPVFNLNCTIK